VGEGVGKGFNVDIGGAGVDVGIDDSICDGIGVGCKVSTGIGVGNLVFPTTETTATKLNIPPNTTTAIMIFLHFFMNPISSPSVKSLYAALYKTVLYTTPP